MKNTLTVATLAICLVNAGIATFAICFVRASYPSLSPERVPLNEFDIYTILLSWLPTLILIALPIIKPALRRPLATPGDIRAARILILFAPLIIGLHAFAVGDDYLRGVRNIVLLPNLAIGSTAPWVFIVWERLVRKRAEPATNPAR